MSVLDWLILVKGVENRRYNAIVTYSNDQLMKKEFGFRVIATDTSDMNINIRNGYINVDSRKSCKLDINETTNKICLEIYLDGSSLEIFISKNISNGAMVGFATYSGQLKTLHNQSDEKTYVYADSDVDANLEVYSMLSNVN